MQRYEEQLEIFQEGASFSKTATDDTFNAHEGRSYAKRSAQSWLQRPDRNREPVRHRLRSTPSRLNLVHLKPLFGALPHVLVADAGYGSEENYSLLEAHDVRAFVKCNVFRKEQNRAFAKDPTQPKNWAFDKEDDSWTCAQGKKLAFLKEKQATSDQGFKSTTRLCKCEDCAGCPY